MKKYEAADREMRRKYLQVHAFVWGFPFSAFHDKLGKVEKEFPFLVSGILLPGFCKEKVFVIGVFNCISKVRLNVLLINFSVII